ncbi:hypothetical protein BV22DRAFT_1036682 [Leucogyrophana mollusca]|uniref:Uncharacterized protein n=1 Tax=Leucogyrophana mollusca TaxID=85980 RepID=A0ACB8BBZ9_9AGAM|nr:hypothetical protein BV22DRAFT_1036682 [Leucogyrophana mollusca]
MADGIPQFMVDDDSPEVAYYPFNDLLAIPAVSEGWSLYYTGSGYTTTPGAVGVGTSYHSTSANGSTLSIQWNGTGIDLFGNVSEATYSLSLDGFPTTSYLSDVSNNILASINDIDNTNHTLLLTTSITNQPTPDSYVTFDKALVTYAPPAGVENSTANSQTINDADDIAFLGQWSYVTDDTGNAMHLSTTAGDRAHTTFLGSAITIYGLVSSYSGNYSVTIDNHTSNFSARSTYNNSEALLFFATDLPQNIPHQLTVTNTEDRTFALRVGGVNVTAFGNVTAMPVSTSSTTTPKGTIAAIVLAGVLILLLVCAAIYYFLIIRPRSRRRQLSVGVQRSVGSPQEEKRMDLEGVIDISPPPGDEEFEVTSMSTSKGYGFGLGLRRSFPFAYRKGKAGSSSSSGKSGEAVAMELRATPRYDFDDKRFSTNTLTVDLSAPESEKLAPGWSNPAQRTSFSASSKSGHFRIGSHGLLLPELRVDEAGDEDNEEDDDADAKTLTSRQDENLAATLSLSPRTSEAPGGFAAAIRRSVMGFETEEDRRQSSLAARDGHLLQVRETSPFRVDVGAILGTVRGNRDSKRTSGSGSSWSRIRAKLSRRTLREEPSQESQSDQQGGSHQLASEAGAMPVMLLAPESVPSGVATLGTQSFLDLSSSASPASSVRRHSKTTTLSSAPADVGHYHEVSQWSSNPSDHVHRTSVGGGVIARPDAPSTVSEPSQPELSSEGSNSHSSPSAKTTRSSPFPFPITIPPSSHFPHPLDATSNPDTLSFSPTRSPIRRSFQQFQATHGPPPSGHNSDPTSPTDSVPFSVSDIHFRHSQSDYAGFDSRRASAASNLPPHPPLPHMSQPGTPAFTPPPPYIVQRVLGMTPLMPTSAGGRWVQPSPTTGQTVVAEPLSTTPLTSPSSTSPFRIGSLLGPRPRPSTAGSVTQSAPQLSIQARRATGRGPR